MVRIYTRTSRTNHVSFPTKFNGQEIAVDTYRVTFFRESDVMLRNIVMFRIDNVILPFTPT